MTETDVGSKKVFGRLLSVIAMIGIVLAVIALYEHTNVTYAQKFGFQAKPSFCNLSERFNCDAVNLSRFATLFHLPLASYALIFYCALFLLALIAPIIRREDLKEYNAVHVTLSFLAVLLSVVLFALSEFAIGTLCIICIGLYLVSLLYLLITYFSIRREFSWFTLLLQGIIVLLRAPLRIFSATREGGALARVFLVALVLSAVIAVTLPEFIFLRIIFPHEALGDPESEEEVAKVVEQGKGRWHQQTLVPRLMQPEANDFVRGPADAPITIVEYADFECPACQDFYLLLNELSANYQGKIRYVFRHFPLDNNCNPAIRQKFHENACYAASLAICAGEQGKYWEMSDYLFDLGFVDGAEQRTPSENQALMHGGIEKVGVDLEMMNVCLESGLARSRIVKDVQSGMELKLRGTPSIWVNGRFVDTPTYPILAALFEEILGDQDDS